MFVREWERANKHDQLEMQANGMRIAPPFYNGGWYNQWLLYTKWKNKRHSIVVLRGGWNMQIPLSRKIHALKVVHVFASEYGKCLFISLKHQHGKGQRVDYNSKWIMCSQCICECCTDSVSLWISVLSVIVITSWLDEIVFTVTEYAFMVLSFAFKDVVHSKTL